MPFPNAATPNRSTQLVIDPLETVSLRPPWDYKRLAAKTGRYSTDLAGDSEQVVLVAANAWMLRPLALENASTIRSTYSGNAISFAEVQMPEGFQALNAWTKPTNLPGVTTGIEVEPTANPTFVKRIPAAGAFNSSLSADIDSFPMVNYESQDIPMSRVLVSYNTYHSDCGWRLAFFGPEGMNGVDNVLTFYFGGPTDTSDPTNHTGGQYGLTLKGNGIAILQELDQGTWKERLQFRWAESSQVSSTWHSLQILPYDRDKIWFYSRSGGAISGNTPFTNTPFGVITAQSTPETTLYTHSSSQCGFYKKQWMTGVGAIRMDVRDDIRLSWQMVQIGFPLTGALVDAPVPCPYVLPDATPIRLNVNFWNPPGTSVVPTVYDAATNSALATDSNGNWLSSHGVNQLYVGFTLGADSLTQYSPVIYDYSLHIDGATTVRTPNTVQVRLNKPLSITGPDLTPDQETAHARLDDAQNQASILQERGRIHAQIVAVNLATNGKNTTLFEGEIAKATSKTLGKVWPTGNHFPSPQARSYELDFVGRWARLADQTLECFKYYSDASQGPEGTSSPQVDGRYQTWRLTDIIKDLLTYCGVPSTAMQIPDNPQRLWTTDNDAAISGYTLTPGTNPSEVLRKLCHDYLGQILCWDPNAQQGGPGPGMWRLFDNPQPPYTPIFNFFTGSPQQQINQANIPHFPNAYGPNSYMVQSYTPHTRAPEANYISVYCVPGKNDGKGTGGTGLIMAQLANFASYDVDPSNPTADPTSPDYLGRYVPLFFVDWSLQGQQAANWICRRLYKMCCHAQQWINFHAPLPFVTPLYTSGPMIGQQIDPLQVQPRPLRINDIVTFTTPTNTTPKTLIIRSCNPTYEDDGYQMADYEALVVNTNDPVSGAINYPDTAMGGIDNLRAG